MRLASDAVQLRPAMHLQSIVPMQVSSMPVPHLPMSDMALQSRGVQGFTQWPAALQS